MRYLSILFNHDGTIHNAYIYGIRGNKIPDLSIWMVWEMYNILVERGYHVTKTDMPDGGALHMICI